MNLAADRLAGKEVFRALANRWLSKEGEKWDSCSGRRLEIVDDDEVMEEEEAAKED